MKPVSDVFLTEGYLYGRIKIETGSYYLYGSKDRRSVLLYSADDLQGDPIGRAHLLPSGTWWIYVYEPGLGRWRPELQIAVASRMAPFVEAHRAAASVP